MSAPSLTVMLLTVSGISLRRQAAHNAYVSGPRPAHGEKFDYVIVGGGTAGGVLAARLTANPGTTVLLLEAGGPQSVLTDMPGNYQVVAGGEYDWNYQVSTQRTGGLAFPNIFIPRAKVFGGCSAVNWSMYLRGNPQDYNNWATKYGLTNMSWPKVLEFFMLFENNTDPAIRANGLHGDSGPIVIRTETEASGMEVQWTRTMNRAGIPTLLDLNGPSQLGTAIGQVTWNENAIRSSVPNGYLEKFPKRPNLTILIRALVQRILLSYDNRRATGVEYRDERTGQSFVAFAKKEVIISAGATNSPQVLMLSGIGIRSHLNEMNIPVVRDLPVGNNLHDLVISPVYYDIGDVNYVLQFPDYNTENEYNYFANADGPLAHYPISYTYYSTANNPNRTWPNGFIVTTAEFLNTFDEVVAEYGSNNDLWRQYWEPIMLLQNGTVGYFLSVLHCLARPKSRGTIRLNVTNPTGAPLIDPAYLADPEDFEAVMDMSRFTLRTLRQYPIANLTLRGPIPGCPACGANCEDEYLACHVRSLARSFYNLVGSNRMGTVGDPNAVVDPNFRVMGFENLRVVDASVIPEIPNGPTYPATLMLAEMAARLIMTGQ